MQDLSLLPLTCPPSCYPTNNQPAGCKMTEDQQQIIRTLRERLESMKLDTEHAENMANAARAAADRLRSDVARCENLVKALSASLAD